MLPFAPTDTNECAVEGSCDQVCINRENGFTCSCTLGYDFVGTSTCKARNGEVGLGQVEAGLAGLG